MRFLILYSRRRFSSIRLWLALLGFMRRSCFAKHVALNELEIRFVNTWNCLSNVTGTAPLPEAVCQVFTKSNCGS